MWVELCFKNYLCSNVLYFTKYFTCRKVIITFVLLLLCSYTSNGRSKSLLSSLQWKRKNFMTLISLMLMLFPTSMGVNLISTLYFWPYSKMSLCLSLSGKFDTPHTLLMNWSKKIQPRTQTWSRLVIGNFRFRPTMTMDFQLLCIYVPKIRFQYFQVSLSRTTLDQRHPDWKNFPLLFRFDKYLKLIKTNKACTTCH